MGPGLIKELVTSDWRPEDRIDDERARVDVRQALDGQGPTTFEMEFVLATRRPEFRQLIQYLGQIETTVNLAVLLAFSDWDTIDRFPYVDGLLRAYPLIPLVVTSLGSSSIKITISGDASEIAKLVGRGGPPPNWRRRLIRTLAAMFAGSLLTLRLVTEVSLPPREVFQERIQQAVRATCGYLPPGSEVTLKLPILEAKIICAKPAA